MGESKIAPIHKIKVGPCMMRVWCRPCQGRRRTGTASIRLKESQVPTGQATHAVERACWGVKLEVTAQLASPTGLCDHFPHTQRCKWVAPSADRVAN